MGVCCICNGFVWTGNPCETEFVFFQAEDGIRDLVRSRGLGDVYKRQDVLRSENRENADPAERGGDERQEPGRPATTVAALALIHIRRCRRAI